MKVEMKVEDDVEYYVEYESGRDGIENSIY